MRRRGVLLPDIWASGPDPIDHKLFVDCQRARAQAWYRGEEWHITEAEYIALWRNKDHYLNKGRSSSNVCLARLDYEKAWQLDNVEIVIRSDHYQRASRERTGKYADQYRRRQMKKQLLKLQETLKDV